MRYALALLMFLLAPAALACEDPVCLVDPDSLALTRVITFEDTQSSNGPGWQVSDLLVLPGAVFGERFAGQLVSAEGDHDVVSGEVLSPLTVVAGAPGQNLSVVFMQGNNVLNGYGAAGFPKRHAQGEGAMAFLFDEDQSAIAFQLRGGEAGKARVSFLDRNGSVIHVLNLPPAGEHAFGFARRDATGDIAGVLITNTDPQGLAIDNIRFGRAPDLS